jgi:hypothetical protein
VSVLPLCFSYDCGATWGSPMALTPPELASVGATPATAPSYGKPQPSYAYPNAVLVSYAIPIGASAVFLAVAPPFVAFTIPATLIVPPIVHATHGHPAWALGSALALTLFTLGGTFTALLAFHPECQDSPDTPPEDSQFCIPWGLAAGAVIGEAVWAVMDVTTQYWNVEAAATRSARVHPTITLTPQHGLFAGLAIEID